MSSCTPNPRYFPLRVKNLILQCSTRFYRIWAPFLPASFAPSVTVTLVSRCSSTMLTRFLSLFLCWKFPSPRPLEPAASLGQCHLLGKCFLVTLFNQCSLLPLKLWAPSSCLSGVIFSPRHLFVCSWVSLPDLLNFVVFVLSVTPTRCLTQNRSRDVY